MITAKRFIWTHKLKENEETFISLSLFIDRFFPTYVTDIPPTVPRFSRQINIIYRCSLFLGLCFHRRNGERDKESSVSIDRWKIFPDCGCKVFNEFFNISNVLKIKISARFKDEIIYMNSHDGTK